jgi:tetratricopeptide (TPR) repeat protein
MGFSGDLKDLSLADLLQSIQQNRRTGTLVLYGSGTERDALYVVDGTVAATAPSEGEPEGGFGEALRRRRVVSAKELEKVQKKRGRKLLRTALAEAGLLDEEGYRAAAESHVRDLTADLFLKPRGRFEFREGEPEKSLFDPDLLAARAQVEAQGVIMEGSRRIDEWGRLGRRISGTDEVFVPTGATAAEGEESQGKVSEEAEELLGLLDGRRDVAACVGELPHGRFRTLELLGELLAAKRARLAAPEELAESAEGLATRGDAAGAVVLLRRALEHARNAVPLRERLAALLERAGRREEAAQERKMVAAAHAQAGRPVAAIAEYERAAALVPSDPTPLERALALAREGKDAPGVAAIAKRLGERFTSLGLPERARSLYVELCGQDPLDGEVAERLGQVLEAMGERREASAVFRRLGRERERRRDLSQALSAYRRAAQVDPSDEEARRLIDDIETGRAEARRRSIRRAIALAALTLAVSLAGVAAAREVLARKALRVAHEATIFRPGAERDRPFWIAQYRRVAADWPYTVAGLEAGGLAEGLLDCERTRADDWERAGDRRGALELRRALAALDAPSLPSGAASPITPP